MPTLPDQLRSKLEKTVVAARDIAEAGAKAALESLAVNEPKFFEHMSEEQRKLRNALRARGRQLGDAKDSTDRQEIKHLVLEAAYEHWHEMLFARFLAENGLLRDITEGIPITLEEAEELGRGQGMDKWTYASHCASGMLPQIFRPNDPLLQFKLPKEHQVRLEELLDDLTAEVFTATDSLGWVYQFWQTRRKNEVNKSEVKIGADELSAVTQLFTEPYMVDFLLHNTLGAWWAGKKLKENPQLAKSAESEDELRKAVSLPGVSWDYLRFVRGADGEGGEWRPAAGTFEGWPENAAELKVLDPCCGSGHFLVTGLHILTAIRMAEEGLSKQQAVDAVLKDNLHGLEIDQRCTQIAAFNLALESWKASGYHVLPQLNIACSGISPGTDKKAWLDLAGDDWRLRNGMERLWEHFQQAPVLGSLIEPSAAVRATVLEEGAKALMPLLAMAMQREEVQKSEAQFEAGVTASGIARASVILTNLYDLVCTNVPYLALGDLDPWLKRYIEDQWPAWKVDLALVMFRKCLILLKIKGHASLVLPQNWLIQPTCGDMRKQLLTSASLSMISKLGPRAFRKISGEVVNVLLLVVTPAHDQTSRFAVIDSLSGSNAEEKAALTIKNNISIVKQISQLNNPDSVITCYEDTTGSALLGSAVSSTQGIKTGDDGHYKFQFWEFHLVPNGWITMQGTSTHTSEYSGLDHVLFWGRNGDHLARRQGLSAWNRPGIAVSQMSDLPCNMYLGGAFDSNITVLAIREDKHLVPVANYAFSGRLSANVRIIDQSIKPTNSTYEKIEYSYEQNLRSGPYSETSDISKPHSKDPTQWIFHGNPVKADEPLQVAVARLHGYRWPAELDEAMELADFQRELVRKCDELLPFADEDGIVCLPSIRNEDSAASRLRKLLSAAYGDEWKAATEGELIKATGSSAGSLEEWLQDDFFEQHCKLFHHRPFVWHIWDGIKHDGFSALVNYHKLAEGGGKGKLLLESLTYSYLGDWISRQEAAKRRGEPGADDRLLAAQELKKRLVAIIEGEPPYDIFVRWKPLKQQAIGWEPDINDGVRLNIRPFLQSDLPKEVCKGAKKGAGILRVKPSTIKWGRDRGKEPHRAKADYPWFWDWNGWDGKTLDYAGGAEFTGVRWNDLHYSNEAKRKAREAKE